MLYSLVSSKLSSTLFFQWKLSISYIKQILASFSLSLNFRRRKIIKGENRIKRKSDYFVIPLFLLVVAACIRSVVHWWDTELDRAETDHLQSWFFKSSFARNSVSNGRATESSFRFVQRRSRYTLVNSTENRALLHYKKLISKVNCSLSNFFGRSFIRRTN